MLLNINRCLNGGRGGEYSRLPHSRWCVCLSVCSYGHICFGFERSVCPSVFVFLPPPSSPTPSVSGGRLRNDLSGFDAVGPCPSLLQHMRPGNYESLLNQSCVTIQFAARSLMRYQCIWCATTIHTMLELGRLSYCCILPDVWRQDVLGSAEGSAMRRVERRWSPHPQQSLDKTLRRK